MLYQLWHQKKNFYHILYNSNNEDAAKQLKNFADVRHVDFKRPNEAPSHQSPAAVSPSVLNVAPTNAVSAASQPAITPSTVVQSTLNTAHTATKPEENILATHTMKDHLLQIQQEIKNNSQTKAAAVDDIERTAKSQSMLASSLLSDTQILQIKNGKNGQIDKLINEIKKLRAEKKPKYSEIELKEAKVKALEAFINLCSAHTGRPESIKAAVQQIKKDNPLIFAGVTSRAKKLLIKFIREENIHEKTKQKDKDITDKRSQESPGSSSSFQP